MGLNSGLQVIRQPNVIVIALLTLKNVNIFHASEHGPASSQAQLRRGSLSPARSWCVLACRAVARRAKAGAG